MGVSPVLDWLESRAPVTSGMRPWRLVRDKARLATAADFRAQAGQILCPRMPAIPRRPSRRSGVPVALRHKRAALPLRPGIAPRVLGARRAYQRCGTTMTRPVCCAGAALTASGFCGAPRQRDPPHRGTCRLLKAGRCTAISTEIFFATH